MLRTHAFLLMLLMAGTVLADDYQTVRLRSSAVELGEPAPALVPDPIPSPGEYAFPTKPKEEGKSSPLVNFNFDERGRRMRHAHLGPNGIYMQCHNTACRVPVPGNLEICPLCKWSVCQCRYRAQAQSSDLQPIPEQGFRSFPTQGPNPNSQCCSSPKPRQTIMGMGFQICKFRVGAGITAPKRDCGCGCGGHAHHEGAPPRRTVIGGGVNVLGVGAGAGITWGE